MGVAGDHYIHTLCPTEPHRDETRKAGMKVSGWEGAALQVGDVAS